MPETGTISEKRKVLMAGVLASSYLAMKLDGEAEKYETCGPNSMCFHATRFAWPGGDNNMQFKLSKDVDYFVAVKEPGGGYLRAYLASPCKADLEVRAYTEDSPVKCENFYPGEVPKARIYEKKCYCLIDDDTGGYSSRKIELNKDGSCAEMNTCDDIESRGELVEDGKLDKYGVVTLSDCGGKKPSECLQEKISRAYGEEAYKYYGEFLNLNINVNTKEEEAISECVDSWKPNIIFGKSTYSIVISPDTESMRRYAGEERAVKEGYSPNFCVESRAQLSDKMSTACIVGSVAGSAAVTAFTGGAAAPVLLYAVGSSGVACEKLMNEAGRWPRSQF